MHIFVIGAGGREHALTWRFVEDGHTVSIAKGNPGTEEIATNVAIELDDLDALVEHAVSNGVDLTVVGPEAPLVAGLADRLRDRGIATFGPGKSGARLEGSKLFAKNFFVRHGIATADYEHCTSMREVEGALERLGDRVVVKADGLAAGKGVVVCDDRQQATAAARAMLEGRRFGEAASELIIEERLTGRELSVMAVADGRSYRVLATAEDHKAIFDGDRGPNTGGMGAVSPASWVTETLIERVKREIFDRTMSGLGADGIDYRGVLYAGIMVGDDGNPMMLEYNCRFGDPETQAVLPRIRGDLGAVLRAAADGSLGEHTLEWTEQCSVGVVIASAGYPERSDTGHAISGLDHVDGLVFHAGTRRDGDVLVNAGGRVLCVVALDDDIDAARARAYAAIDGISFSGMQFRRDIGRRGAI